MSTKTLSVILPNFNQGHYIADALKALVEQTRPPDEIIVVDDGSTDDSVKVIELFSRQYSQIRLLRHAQNIGGVEAARTGGKEAKGEFLYFAAADDRVFPNFFKKSLELLMAHPEAGICSALALDLGPDGETQGPVESPLVSKAPRFICPKEAGALLHQFNNWFIGNTVVYRRNCLEALGMFDPSLGSYCDSFICSVIALKHGACFIPEYLGGIRRMEGTFSAKMTGDTNLAIAMFTNAKKLMEGTYADLFPAKYVKVWDRRWRYAVLAGLILKRRNTPSDLQKLLAEPTLIDHVLLSLIPTNSKAQDLYLFARMTPGDFFKAFGRKFTRSLSFSNLRHLGG